MIAIYENPSANFADQYLKNKICFIIINTLRTSTKQHSFSLINGCQSEINAIWHVFEVVIQKGAHS